MKTGFKGHPEVSFMEGASSSGWDYTKVINFKITGLVCHPFILMHLCQMWIDTLNSFGFSQIALFNRNLLKAACKLLLLCNQNPEENFFIQLTVLAFAFLPIVRIMPLFHVKFGIIHSAKLINQSSSCLWEEKLPKQFRAKQIFQTEQTAF